MSDDALVGLISTGFGISDAAKKPAVPKTPDEMNMKAALAARQRVAQAQGLSSTLIAGRTSRLGVPGGAAAA